jgi:hypothetical protein
VPLVQRNERAELIGITVDQRSNDRTGVPKSLGSDDVSFLLQALDRIPDRRTAHAELERELVLDEPSVRREPSLVDGVSKGAIHPHPFGTARGLGPWRKRGGARLGIQRLSSQRPYTHQAREWEEGWSPGRVSRAR